MTESVGLTQMMIGLTYLRRNVNFNLFKIYFQNCQNNHCKLISYKIII